MTIKWLYTIIDMLQVLQECLAIASNNDSIAIAVVIVECVVRLIVEWVKSNYDLNGRLL